MQNKHGKRNCHAFFVLQMEIAAPETRKAAPQTRRGAPETRKTAPKTPH